MTEIPGTRLCVATYRNWDCAFYVWRERFRYHCEAWLRRNLPSHRQSCGRGVDFTRLDAAARALAGAIIHHEHKYGEI